MDGELTPVTRKLGTHGQTFGSTNLKGRVLSCEIGVPYQRTPEAVEIILGLAKKHLYAGLIALRYVKRSPATLAFTCHAPYTCTIELPGAYASRTESFY